MVEGCDVSMGRALKQPIHNLDSIARDSHANNNSLGAEQERAHPAILALIGAAYFIAHELAFIFPDSAGVLEAIWPAGGVGLAALLLTQKSQWRSVVSVLYVAGCAADLLARRPIFASLGYMLSNLVESLLGAWVLERWAGPVIYFNRVRDVQLLILVATAVNAVSSLLGAATAALASGASFWPFYFSWWISDGLGILLVAPLIVCWVRKDILILNRLRWRLEFTLILIVSLVIAWAYFGPKRFTFAAMPHSYMLIAPLAWAALRVGPRGVITIQSIVAAVVLAATVFGYGLFPLGGKNPTEQMEFLQLFLAGTCGFALLLAASFSEQKLAQLSLLHSDAGLRALGDNLPNGVVYQVTRDSDDTRKFVHISGGVRRLNGLEPEDVLRDASLFYNQVVPEDRHIYQRARDHSVESMSVFNVIVRMRRADGQVRWMHLCSAPRKLPDGGIVWDGIETDITEEREKDLALRESEARYRRLLEEAPIGITILDENEILYASPEAARMLGGSSAEDIVHRSPFEFMHPEIRAKMKDRVAAAIARSGPLPPVEWKIRRLDGAENDVETRGIRISYMGKTVVQSLMVDISERKRAEEMVQRQIAFDEALKIILARFASSPAAEIDNSISTALRELSVFVGVQSAFVSRASRDGATWSCTHEWCDAGIASHIAFYQGVRIGTFLKNADWNQTGKIQALGGLDEIPEEGKKLREEMDARGFQSIVQLPFRGRGGAVSGFMVMLSKTPRTWRNEELQRLQMAANAIAHALERQRASEHLQKSREQLRLLLARLQSLREQERLHIAREIHDHLGQLLTALNLDLRLIERKCTAIGEPALREAVTGKVASARALADETTSAVQKIAAELRPAILDKLGLVAAIESEAAAFEGRTGIACHLDLPEESNLAPVEQATAFFRIFQEILTNVARHAKAKSLSIHLRQDEERILMQLPTMASESVRISSRIPNRLGCSA
jgi:PAS domain S-box-containing protein